MYLATTQQDVNIDGQAGQQAHAGLVGQGRGAGGSQAHVISLDTLQSGYL